MVYTIIYLVYPDVVSIETLLVDINFFETRKHKNISNKSMLRQILKEPAIVCLKTKFAFLETLPHRYFSRSMEGSQFKFRQQLAVVA
jgi:hypothetical protein